VRKKGGMFPFEKGGEEEKREDDGGVSHFCGWGRKGGGEWRDASHLRGKGENAKLCLWTSLWRRFSVVEGKKKRRREDAILEQVKRGKESENLHLREGKETELVHADPRKREKKKKQHPLLL